jgi:hypothetical protein
MAHAAGVNGSDRNLRANAIEDRKHRAVSRAMMLHRRTRYAALSWGQYGVSVTLCAADRQERRHDRVTVGRPPYEHRTMLGASRITRRGHGESVRE